MHALSLLDSLTWTPNIWMGVSVESYRYTHRIEALRQIPAAVRFVSFVSQGLAIRIIAIVLSAIPASISLEGIQWAIIGGESRPGARPMQPEWVTELRQLCRGYGTAFFFKQWGGVNKKAAGRVLEGQTWDEMPTDPDRVQQLSL